MVAELAGWPSGACERSGWVKPPGGAPLTFHRDSPYLDFVPNDVVTVGLLSMTWMMSLVLWNIA